MADQPFVLGVLVGDGNARSPYVKSLLQTASEQGITAYSVTPRHLIAPDDSTRWPDVVYNRIPTRREEVSILTQKAKRMLQDRSTPMFNARFFNKREIDDVLRREPETAELLPATLVDFTIEQARAMLDRHRAVFIKPITGSFGEGICRVSRESDQYRMDIRQPFRTVARYYGTLEECIKACRAHMRGFACLMQEEIALSKYEDCKTDFRVHVHRLNASTWHIISVGAKVAHQEAITTHVHSGGRVEDANLVLAQWFGSEWMAARTRLEDAAVRVCQQLTQVDPDLGEVGLDMGIDRDGRIVVFEANAKPGRAIFTHPMLKQDGIRSRLAVLQYARFLASRQPPSVFTLSSEVRRRES